MSGFRKVGLQVADRRLLPLLLAESEAGLLLRCMEAGAFLSHFFGVGKISVPVDSELRGVVKLDGAGEFLLVTSGGDIVKEQIVLPAEKIESELLNKLVVQAVL